MTPLAPLLRTRSTFGGAFGLCVWSALRRGKVPQTPLVPLARVGLKDQCPDGDNCERGSDEHGKGAAACRRCCSPGRRSPTPRRTRPSIPPRAGGGSPLPPHRAEEFGSFRVGRAAMHPIVRCLPLTDIEPPLRHRATPWGPWWRRLPNATTCPWCVRRGALDGTLPRARKQRLGVGGSDALEALRSLRVVLVHVGVVLHRCTCGRIVGTWGFACGGVMCAAMGRMPDR
mmetsp:Transcript_16105/g.36093  ORF Transcript_16105/g.36093 Transcript_16105/m.36093 type:complete len:229 (+) Transcript_16105:138-824(+)